MASLEPPFPWGRNTHRRGQDPQEMEALFGRVLSYISNALPDPPVSADGDLCILFDADGGGVDRLSLLPDKLLGNIISRLTVKEAARTAALSRRWRPIWRATPLVLVDTHLLPAGGDEIPRHLDRASSSAVAAAVSRVLAAHPGPFRCVRLACCYMGEHRTQFVRWLKILADKGVQDLFLINRPWPLQTFIKSPIPDTLFVINLTCLYLGLWKFPDTAGLPRGAAFPRLRELGLFYLCMESRDIDFVISRSPVLEVLCFQGLFLPLRLCLVSQSLRCVQISVCKLDSIVVVDAPRLERLLLQTTEPENGHTRIKIGHAPALRLLGHFKMEKNELQVGNTIIKAGTVTNPSVMVPTVKILGVTLRFGVRSDAKMLPSFLRCFPNADQLHIHSKKTTESTGRLSVKFWQESGSIKSIQSGIDMLSFRDFRGERGEVAFLKFFIENAQRLTTLVIVYANGCLGSTDEAASKAKALFAGKRASKRCLLVVCENAHAGGGDLWDYQRGSDFSSPNPLAVIECSSLGAGRWSV
ncbi:unnamed protein product [Urochloa decumbens]|uniref:F-box domain-containing protein n=1 Tax=Urochloa decumbens TaxID=240449 RepID=A0ABC9DBA7_9POAL